MDNYFDWDTVFIDNNGNYVIPVVLSKVGNKKFNEAKLLFENNRVITKDGETLPKVIIDETPSGKKYIKDGKFVLEKYIRYNT